jgi:hypothetical protein
MCLGNTYGFDDSQINQEIDEKWDADGEEHGDNV